MSQKKKNPLLPSLFYVLKGFAKPWRRFALTEFLLLTAGFMTQTVKSTLLLSHAILNPYAKRNVDITGW